MRAGRPINGLPETISVPSDASTSQIFQEIANASKFSIHRLRVTKGSDGTPIPSTRDVTVHQTGLRNKSAIDVKDLGTSAATSTSRV
jgi:very-long-chain enoyl-CoA reductase